MKFITLRTLLVQWVLFLSMTINWTFGSSGPISYTGSPIFPRFTEQFDPSLLEMEVNEEELPSARFRLPNQIIPQHYKLQIRPILQGDPMVQNFTAPGTVQITVQCRQATRELVLHAAELVINSLSIRVWRTSSPTEQLIITDQISNATLETFTIVVQDNLVVGERYDIYIEYVATVANPDIETPGGRMNGVYWSSYQTETGDKRYLATTQFSRTRAFRKTLPSFDEPSQKATFEIIVGREDSYHSLSNMNLLRSEPIAELQGWTWDFYNTTPVMPPTIIAFIVSDFDFEDATEGLFEKPVKIWGPPAEIQGNGAVFAANAAAETLNYFQEYFGIQYELPKIDSAAIPDFAAGAMENWGLNTYRVMYLIWKEGINTVAEKFRIANILGHELAHQYWGNLVTHAWWNDWWLTEGFASYFEYRSVDAVFVNGYEAIDRLVTSDIQPAMAFDSGPDSVPIHGVNSTHFVENPSTINYSKGAALVNLMRSFMTEQVFKMACNYYLRNRAYLAVHQDALFTDFNTYLATNNLLPSNNKTINEIMETWTTQTSFPLVKVSRAGPNHIFVSQERFENVEVKGQQPQTGLWHVPIFYTTADNPTFDSDNNLPKFWIDKEVLVMMHAVDTSKWILVNPGGNGYYRVIYDTHLETLLQTELDTTIINIPVGSRSMIVDDYFTAAYQGYIPITRALAMTSFLSRETNFNVWVPFQKHFRRGYELFSNESQAFDTFQTYILQTMQTALDNVGFTQIPSELPMTTISRVQLFDWACPLFHNGCVDEANRLLSLWQSNPTNNPIPVDIRPSIYCAATNDNGNWDFLWQQYMNTNRDPLIRNSLACTPHLNKLTELLTKVKTEDLGTVDVIGILVRAAANRIIQPTLLDELLVEFDTLIQPDKLGPTGYADVFAAICTHTYNLTVQERIQTWVSLPPQGPVLTPVMGRVETSLALIDSNKQWVDNFGSPILQWMTTQIPPLPTPETKYAFKFIKST